MTEYPDLKRRYISSALDGVVLLFAMILLTIVFASTAPDLVAIRVSVILLVIINYEPILTSKLSTLGQAVTGIRVRQYANRQARIPLARAYVRTVVKVLLGVYSLFAMGFSRDRRAVHDYAAGSIVLEASKPVLPA
jgi:uncharacterized RDD family membrane protein YckC